MTVIARNERIRLIKQFYKRVKYHVAELDLGPGFFDIPFYIHEVVVGNDDIWISIQTEKGDILSFNFDQESFSVNWFYRKPLSDILGSPEE